MKRELRNLKINPEEIKRKVNTTLNADLAERKLYMKHKIAKTALIAAAVTALLATSAFAMSDTGQEFIGNIISYFGNAKAVEISSLEELSRYNNKVGVSASDNGYTLTVDNVAMDDNFVHVFYTFTSEQPFYPEGDIDLLIDAPMKFWQECKIDGKSIDIANHNDYEGYFADAHTYKAVNKYNIAGQELPEKFRLNFSAVWNLPETDPEDMREVSVSADIDTTAVKVDSVTKDVNQYLDFMGGELEKIVFSPFGNQLVLKTDAPENPDAVAGMVDCFALFDENGTALDVLNTDLCISSDSTTYNSLEFLKADVNTKQLKFVPIKMQAVKGDFDFIKQKIGTYPMVFEVSDYGKVIVTDIRISDGRVEIDYYKDGVFMFDPEFSLQDDNGEDVYPWDGNIRCLRDIKTDHENNSYTAVYQFYYYDEQDRNILAKEEASTEILRREFTTLSEVKQNFIKLDYDNAVTVDLK